MKWVNFLHIYQPANQVEEIFHRVVHESYEPLAKALKDNPETKITLNINAALSEQLLERGYQDLIDDIIFVAQRGQIEFTDSAKYHALLPFLEEEEIIRQIELNRETNNKIFGPVYDPKGFFPPEMAYDPNIVPILKKMDYEWIIIDEIGFNGKINQVDTNQLYTIDDSGLFVFFRERSPSNLIMSALTRSERDFREIMGQEYKRTGYMITGMDGETFGHHRPGLQKLLTGLLTSKDFEHTFFSELLKEMNKKSSISPVISTWASTEKDIESGEQFLTWKDDKNELHNMQWELQNIAISAVHGSKSSVKDVNLARNKLDQALASDQFFWASARPWWSLEVIELGAWLLLDTIQSVPGLDENIINKSKDLYNKIIALAFEWQRTGYIRNIYKQYKENPRISFKDRTIGQNEPWVYDAFIELMRQAMNSAAEKEDFEEAILWRDAIWKLNTKNDIYDAVHAIDILRKQITNAEILDMMGKYRREYERLSSGQPEQRE